MGRFTSHNIELHSPVDLIREWAIRRYCNSVENQVTYRTRKIKQQEAAFVFRPEVYGLIVGK